MNNSEIELSIISITLMLLLLVAGILIVFFVSARQKTKQEITIAQNKLNYEKELRKVETEVSEQTLGQVAEELHDNINSLLTGVSIQIQNQRVDHPELKEGLETIGTNLSGIIDQIRMMSRSLNNDYIGFNGLLVAMEIEIKRICTLRKFEVHWRSYPGKPNLDKNQELMLFRVFQEIMQNSIKHSMAKNVYITINADKDNFELQIEDDGEGFDFESIMQSPKASGLRNIIKRAKWANMNCNIISAPGKGCTYILKKMPVKEISA